MPIAGKTTTFSSRAKTMFGNIADYGHAFEGAHSVDARIEVPGKSIASVNGTPSDRIALPERPPWFNLVALLGVAWVIAGS